MLCLPKSSTKEGEKILEWTRELNNNFYWILEPVTGNGAYQIKNLNSNKVLSVEDASMEARGSSSPDRKRFRRRSVAGNGDGKRIFQHY